MLIVVDLLRRSVGLREPEAFDRLSVEVAGRSSADDLVAVVGPPGPY